MECDSTRGIGSLERRERERERGRGREGREEEEVKGNNKVKVITVVLTPIVLVASYEMEKSVTGGLAVRTCMVSRTISFARSISMSSVVLSPLSNLGGSEKERYS